MACSYLNIIHCIGYNQLIMVDIVGAIIEDHETTQLHPSPGMREIVCSEVKTHTIREKTTL